MSDHTKTKFGSDLEIVMSLDETLTIWKSDKGYFWIDRHLSIWSNQFFKTELQARSDCKDLVVRE